MKNILLIEDNEAIQEINKDLLEEVGGYTVRLAMNLGEARRAVAESTPDLIVLDIMLPDGSGLDYLKELKSQMPNVPVILLTALSEVSDEVRGIRDGGDDYIAKPASSDVLLARIEGLLRRAGRHDVAEYGRMTVNFVSRRVLLDGEDAGLTAKEFLLLTYFLKNMNKRLTAEEIYKEVWGLEPSGQVPTVRVHIKELRRKLRMEDEIAVFIETEERKYYVCRFEM
ncbi:MAG: response regulator transcription factor [Defluviitaleaceae bacterium]|nr:response regulator transcription factor [Defluviitaleaceae bacterium]